MKIIKQYYFLNADKKKLVDRISNLSFPIFCLVVVFFCIVIALMIGFSLSEVPKINKDTESGVLLGGMTLVSIPFSMWISWGLAAIPFVLTGQMELNELSTIMRKLKYPKSWFR